MSTPGAPGPGAAGGALPTQQMRWHPVAGTPALQRQATERILDAAALAIRARGRFIIVLSGGNTPRGVYARLRHADVDWPRWEVWFGDERCLPADDPERNSAMACDAWLSHVPIAAERIHVIPGELGAEAAARGYRDLLRARLPRGPAEQHGDFDLVLLGLGEDGHTASLFPGRDPGRAADAPEALAVFDASKPPPQRVSLSASRLARTRQTLVLVDGEGKREAVSQWRAAADIPARAICPPGGVDVLVEASLLPADG